MTAFAPVKEKMLFLSKFFRSPKQIGSVTPSSKHLARTMVEAVPWAEVQAIAELGAGTGAITKFIQPAANVTSAVLLFEQDPHLRARLSEQYPGFSCYPNACELVEAIRSEGIAPLDCILSGLPFFNFPQSVRDRLMEQIWLSLKPGGWFVAFQYSRQMKNQFSQYFDLEHIHFVLLNIPPAFVYVCRKRGKTDHV